jgi:hypothetical protein
LFRKSTMGLYRREISASKGRRKRLALLYER